MQQAQTAIQNRAFQFTKPVNSNCNPSHQPFQRLRTSDDLNLVKRLQDQQRMIDCNAILLIAIYALPYWLAGQNYHLFAVKPSLQVNKSPGAGALLF